MPSPSWTGHPFVDVGLATLCAMTGREAPSKLSSADFDRAAGEMEQYYFSDVMTAYLTCVFPNAAYVQTGMRDKERRAYADRVLHAHHLAPAADLSGLACAFCSTPAVHLAHRSQIPLLTGEGVLNFYPNARGGLPVCGRCLVAIQALPLGGRRVEGRLLIVHADDPAVTIAISRKYVDDNRRLLAMVAAGGWPAADGPVDELPREHAALDKSTKRGKYPDAKCASSLVTSDLVDAWRSRSPITNPGPVTLSAYWLSNSGQGASLDIFQVPSPVLRFLILANADATSKDWQQLVTRGWLPLERDQPSGDAGARRGRARRSGVAPVSGGPGRSRNVVLDDLLAIYDRGVPDRAAARRFTRRHLLRAGNRPAVRAAQTSDGGVSLKYAVPWALLELFLREVLRMNDARIAAIKQFADRLAEYVARSGDRGVFRDLVYGTKAWEVRNALTKAQRNRAKEHDELLFGLDDYLAVFLADDAVGLGEWSLTRDLISIRLVERLHDLGFFASAENKALLEEAEPQVVSAD